MLLNYLQLYFIAWCSKLECSVSSGCIVVEHLPHHPKVKVSSPSVAGSTGRENGKLECLSP